MFRDKLLASAFIASLVVNVAFLLLVGNSDIFQHADVLNDLHAQQIRVYKPPVPQKPKPKIKKPLPPKKKLPQPKQNLVIKPIPPKPVIHSTPKPPKVNVVSTGSHVHGGPGIPMAPSSGSVGIPSTTTVPVQPQTQPTPTPQPQPTPQPSPEPATKPVPTPPPPQPKPAIPDRPTPEIIGSWSDLQLPSDVDTTTLSSSSIDVEWDVDMKGRARNIKFPSTGNDEADEAIRRFIENHHFEPAVQGGEPQEAHMEHTFTLG